MSPESSTTARTPFVRLLHRALVFLAVLVVARFVLELVGLRNDIARYISSTTGMLFVAIYVAAVAPLRGGMQRFRQLLLPALLLSAWTEAWIIVATIIAAVFRLERSHFAEKEDYGNWGHLFGQHLVGHVAEIGIFFVVILLLMAVVHLLWRWPVTVAPGAMLGAFVIMRFWMEAMGVEPWRAAAWSTTVLIFLSAFYLGGVGAKFGLAGARQLLVPSLMLGWTWRFWVYLATLFAALVPFYKTHFFDPSQGAVAARLVRALAGSVIEGFIAGLIVWGIAIWMARATQPPRAE
ncbi:MAG: hypothetical protein ABSF14_03470 [Terriglobia bacterium]|jgi:hypothetical protein